MFNLARSYQLAENYQKALKYYEKVVELFDGKRIAGQARYRIGQIPDEFKETEE